MLTYQNGAWGAAPARGGLLPQAVVTTTAGASVTATLDDTTVGPVVAGEDGVATLDLPSYGTWTLTAALDDKTSSDTLIVDDVKQYSAALQLSLLPAGFVQLEYLESTGTQYIKSDLVPPSSGYRVVGKVEFKASNSGQYGIYGAYKGNPKANVHTMINFNSSTPVWSISWNSEYYGGSLAKNVAYNFEMSALENAPTLSVNGSPVTLSSVYNFSTDVGLKFYIFGQNNEDALAIPFVGRIYELAFYSSSDDSSLLAHYYACRYAKGVLGLYDMVSNTFYPNAGSGSFIAGPEVYALAA